MDEELRGLIEEYRDLVQACIDHVDELESMVMDGILNPVKQEMERAELMQRKEEFMREVGDKLSVFDKKLRIIEHNPEFSLNDVAFDEYDNMKVAEGEEKPTPTEFADKLVESVTEQIAELTEALNNADTTEEAQTIADEAKDVIDNAVEEKKEEIKSEENGGVEKPAEDLEKEKVEVDVDVDENGEELSEDDKEELERMKENVRKALGVYGK